MRLALPVALAALLATSAARGEDPFAVREVPSPGRTVAAELADLDGDGRADLFAVVFSGVPPRDSREVRVYFQREDGALPDVPDRKLPLPEGSAAYDLVEVSGVPGRALALLRRDRVTTLAFPGRELATRDLPTPGPTFATVRDERGLDRLLMAREGLAGRLLVPGLGELFVLDALSGAALRLAVGSRANYFLPLRPGAQIGENEIEQYADFPRIDVADVDGDGRADLVTSNRFEVRVFRQDAQGVFPARADQSLDVGRITEEDMIRGSGLVRLRVDDLDGDARADLLVTYTAGGVLRSRTRTTLHYNRSGTWNLAAPDLELACEKCFATYEVADLDGDGRGELVEARIELAILEFVEILLTSSIDLDVKVYRRAPGQPFTTKPWYTDRIGIGFRFEVLEPSGFFPTLNADWNGDGARDRIESGKGEAIELSLGGSPASLRSQAARQPSDTHGSLRIGDLDADGLPDLVVFDRTRPDTPIRIGVNRGVLPGTPPKASVIAPTP
jgi:hypothetical protein